MSWYYVDIQGGTQGPVTMDQMKGKYASKEIKDETYIWNGTDVKDWTSLSNVPQILKQLKPLEAPGPPSGPGPAVPRRNPMGGGGGNAALLAAIRKGATLNKVEVPDKSEDEGTNNQSSNNVSSSSNNTSSSSNNTSSSASNNVTAARRPARQTVQEEMAARLRARSGGGATAKVGGTQKPDPKPEVKASNDTVVKNDTKPSTTLNSTQNKMSSQSSQKKLNVDDSDQTTSSSSNPIVARITAKLENAEEWQLKAIEKILS